MAFSANNDDTIVLNDNEDEEIDEYVLKTDDDDDDDDNDNDNLEEEDIRNSNDDDDLLFFSLLQHSCNPCLRSSLNKTTAAFGSIAGIKLLFISVRNKSVSILFLLIKYAILLLQSYLHGYVSHLLLPSAVQPFLGTNFVTLHPYHWLKIYIFHFFFLASHNADDTLQFLDLKTV